MTHHLLDTHIPPVAAAAGSRHNKSEKGAGEKREGRHLAEPFSVITENNTGPHSKESYFCVALECSVNNPNTRMFKSVSFKGATCDA